MQATNRLRMEYLIISSTQKECKTKFNFDHMLLDALVSTLMDQTMPIKPFSIKGISEITFFVSLIRLQKR